MTTQKLLEVLLFMPGFLFSLSFHEAAHAYVAYKRGDYTAKALGRVTLNPWPHTDVLGTLVLPVFGLLFGGFLFGWGKPVPVDYRNLKNVKRDGLLIAAAGPVSNLILAILLSLVLRYFAHHAMLLANILPEHLVLMLFTALKNIFVLNLALFVFNLIPVQPLDGSKILFGLIPGRLAMVIDDFTTRYGMFILIILMMSGSLQKIMWPPIVALADLLLG